MRALKGLLLPAASAQARLPVALLSGCLGAGKTTLVNALLRDPRLARTAVAVNEFGAVPLDADLIDHGADKTLVLANGCLCCNLSGDLEEAILRVFTRRSSGELPDFDRLIIEPSGLSDPAPIATSLLRNPLMAAHFRLETIITVVDAVHIHQQLARDDTTAKQIALADTVILTKLDLADPATQDATRARLGQLNPLAPIVAASGGAADATAILPDGFFAGPSDMGDRTPARAAFLAEPATTPHDLSEIVAVALTETRPLNWRALEHWLRQVRITHGEQLLRLKGIAHVAGHAGPVILHGVHHVLHAPVDGEAWSQERPATRLVFIVERAISPDITARWTNALPELIA